MSDDVSNEEVDAVEFTRVVGSPSLTRYDAAFTALVTFGSDADFEEATKELTRIAAKAMRRK